MSQHANRLIHETSPYLRQHAHNPVDWYPWGEEALERARAEDRPILLSIGYAACHWCHVMERESFEDEATARLMNESFVCIKVDREERPDLDAIYMQATQALTGRGGWPMTVFLTRDGAPYYAGTYFPPQGRYGMPGFPQVLQAMAEAWRERREAVLHNAQQLTAMLAHPEGGHPEPGPPALEIIERAAARLVHSFDPREGGFGRAPKFPHPMAMALLLRHHRRTGSAASLHAVTFTLECMARGGIYDQLGGGFARYSVDGRWLVPHFEKMLYDNALLAGLLVEAWQVTHDGFLRDVASETLDYVLRDMTSPEGGFYATEDADSEGEEGRFYAWTPDEVREAVGDARVAKAVCDWFGVTEEGNFEHGRSILHRPHAVAEVAARHGFTEDELVATVAEARRRLLEVRSRRVRPARDEKIITAWNGLMLDALARAAAAFGRDDYLEAARRCASFLLDRLVVESPTGMRVLRVHTAGASRLNGYLEDYAAMAGGLLSLYEASFEPRWLEAARSLLARTLALFWDEGEGCFYFTSVDHERLVARVRDPYDNATPSGSSLAVSALLRLAALDGDERHRVPAERVLCALRQPMEEVPLGFGQLLCALDFFLGPPLEISLSARSWEEAREWRAAIFGRFLPHKGVRGTLDAEGRVTASVCRDRACLPPITDLEALVRAL